MVIGGFTGVVVTLPFCRTGDSLTHTITRCAVEIFFITFCRRIGGAGTTLSNNDDPRRPHTPFSYYLQSEGFKKVGENLSRQMDGRLARIGLEGGRRAGKLGAWGKQITTPY